MSEWLDNQKKSSGNFLHFLQERIEKANLRHQLTAEEAKRLSKLEAIADKIKHGENVKIVSCKRGQAKKNTNKLNVIYK